MTVTEVIILSYLFLEDPTLFDVLIFSRWNHIQRYIFSHGTIEINVVLPSPWCGPM